MAKLDKNKPFGTVYGNSATAYEQDGRLFDHAGHLIQDDQPDAPAKEVKKPRTKKAEPDAPTEEDAQIKSQMGS